MAQNAALEVRAARRCQRIHPGASQLSHMPDPRSRGFCGLRQGPAQTPAARVARSPLEAKHRCVQKMMKHTLVHKRVLPHPLRLGQQHKVGGERGAA